ncbi:hypothetical protein [Labedaea rhizosphaerae]|uniref:Uncharacterized protein n=1 Tax=Labedaea rhizosphaerae TaxID=598644 RepID=A0A4R6S991_LABRH|nr:hypothetical protein [Labedaea rhizosphaerae]TDP96440.1 hypothetical protein EV186_104428 [Labedaea rhizosphaerae]
MPEPVLVSIAAALATKAVSSLYDMVKKRFEQRAEARAALEAATAAPQDEQAVHALAERLAVEETADPEFSRALRAEWAKVSVEQRADRGGVTNQVTGEVSGKVVQARDIHGDVSF